MKSLVRLIILLIIPFSGNAQKSSDLAFQEFKELQKKEFKKVENDTSKILTQPAINLFFVRRLAFYSGSADDISLFSNYAFADIAEGRLSVGKNFRFDNPLNKRLTHMLSLGLNTQADGEKKIAFLYQDGDFTGRMGLDIGFTYFKSGTIWFDGNKQKQSFHRKKKGDTYNDKSVMKVNRRIALAEIEYQWKQDSAYFYNSIVSVHKDEQKKFIEKFHNNQFKKYSSYLITNEVDKFEADTAYNAYRLSWGSVKFNLPLTGSRYWVAPDFNSFAVEREQWRVSASLQWNFVFESVRKGKIFVYGGLGVIHQNSIETNDLKLITLDEYKGLGGRDSTVLNTGNSLYVGSFKRFNDGKAYAKVLYYVPKYDWIGVSLFTEYQFGERGQILNMYAGLPMSFAGKGDSRVNLELQFRFTNVINTLNAQRNDENKYSLGIKLGIPFGQSTF